MTAAAREFHVAIETSGRVGSIAVSKAGRVLFEEIFAEGLVHGREILPRLRSACTRLGFTPAEIDLVVAGVGPGSLTGIRVGLTTAKTLAFATGCAVVGVVSTDALARRAPEGFGRIACAIDARCGEVFAASYAAAPGEGPAREGDVELLDPAALVARLDRGALVIGDAIARYGDRFREAGLVLAPPEEWFPRASDLLRLGEARFAAGQADDFHVLRPLYLRESVTTPPQQRRSRV